MSKAKWLKIGAVIRKKELGKDGEPQYYLSISSGKSKDGRMDFDEIVLRSGDKLQLQKPIEELDRLVELGFIDEDERDRRAEKIPDFVLYHVVLPPQK